MFKPKEYIGISLEGDALKIARVVSGKNTLRLVRVDQLNLVEPIERPEHVVQHQQEDAVFDDELDADSIFGLEDGEQNDVEIEEEEDLLGEIDLDNWEEEFEEDTQKDLTNESEEAATNEMLFYNYMSSVEGDRKHATVNIPAGDTIFQFLTDTNYSELKKKELLEIIEEKLYAIYNSRPNENLYDFQIQDDGSLLIGSLEAESPTLQLVSETNSQFKQNYIISDVVADESIMMGLYRQHYTMDHDSITALLQLGKNKCRILFMKGSKLLQVSPIINEGYSNSNYLNTVFSKILFQLDTGEVPGLDHLIIFNNPKGDKVLDFFQSSFKDLTVENFGFNKDVIAYSDSLAKIVPAYTTAIGLALNTAKSDIVKKIDLTFLPDHVIDQQKIFKLQWHGIVLLILIGITPVILNHFYQQNQSEIDSLQQESNQLQSMITEIDPLVEQAEQLSEQLSVMQNQLTLLTDLSENNLRWTVTMDRFNQAVQNTGNMWINSFRQNEDVLMVDGYSLYQQRIPELAGQFESVTLLNVRKQEIRERDIFFFTMMIRDVIADKTLYTPQANREFQELTSQ